MQNSLAHCREMFVKAREVGSIFPSSNFLARKMVARLEDPLRKPLKILEVGPGSGPMTKRIVELMIPGDHLSVVEINPRLIAMLESALQDFGSYQAKKQQIEFYNQAVQDFAKNHSGEKFDFIVSSLPFSNFSASLVEEILNSYAEILSGDGSIVFFEYAGLRKVGALVVPGRMRNRLREVEETVSRWFEKWSEAGFVDREYAFLNLPPAVFFQCSRKNVYSPN